MSNYKITGDRPAILRDLRRHYGAETKIAAWEKSLWIAKKRKVSPVKVNWDFCLFMAERERRRK